MNFKCVPINFRYIRFQHQSHNQHQFPSTIVSRFPFVEPLTLPLIPLGSASTPGDLWYNFIELPYHGESISMLIALPTETSTPLSALIPHISTNTIDSWMSIMVPKRVQVILPK